MDEQFCENCGKGNTEDATYCYACGHILPVGLKALATHTLGNSDSLHPQIRWGTAYFGEQSVLRVHVRHSGTMFETKFQSECILGRSVGDVKFAFISVPFLLGRAATPNDIDILMVGPVQMRRVGEIVKTEEKRRGQEINYAVLSEREFNELKKRRDPLILSALLQPKIILTPNSHEYLSL